MQIRWTRKASYNLDAIEKYIEKDKPIAAAKTVLKIIKTVGLLAKNPQLGRPGKVGQTRELIISNTPYIIPYRINNDTIEILRVIHSAMKWPESF